MTLTRRNMCLLLSTLATSSSLGVAAENSKLPSKVYRFEDLPVRKNGGNESRPLLSGALHDGKYLESHETLLAPGAMPHPPHHHLHEEMFLVRDGTIETTIRDQSTRIGPGSVMFVASNEEHSIRNVGATPAQYFVVALGKD
jgi:mannose-6-phosphate isomerase-like protein (cupin superfamily)